MKSEIALTTVSLRFTDTHLDKWEFKILLGSFAWSFALMNISIEISLCLIIRACYIGSSIFYKKKIL